ncbi:Subtilase family protein [Cellulosimicrobium cellulans]|nr:Subtilase family protein [Cellulosimicrobium cellulans]
MGPEAADLSSALDALPGEACPENEAVAVVTLHPQSLAKSYHPKKLLDQYQLRQVGSRPVQLTPEKWTKKGDPTQSHATQLYVAGNRRSFRRWAEDFESFPDRISEAIQRLEEVHAPLPEDRLRNLDRAERTPEGLLIELVLHASADDDYILQSFMGFTEALGIDAQFRRRLYAGGLCFLPAEVHADQLQSLGQFAFLRVARPVSRIRQTPMIERAISAPNAPRTPLPKMGVVDADVRVAIFDGGFPSESPLAPWVTTVDLPDVGPAVPEFEDHGHDVASALLFGTLRPGESPTQPPATVDLYRVLDKDSKDDPFDLYDVIRRIEEVLSANSYDFVNLSLGPAVCVEDDDVHPWTAVLDTYLSSGQTLATVAVGNNGEHSDISERRIQVPADSVNALSLGAANSARRDWVRAQYSAFGPGRSPGVVKPDVLDFGGSETEPFIVYDRSTPGGVAYTHGTSFASPAALRRGVAMRAHFGERLTPLGIRALLVRAAGDNNLDRAEVGWGRLPTSLEEIMVCEDGQVRVIYQGTLQPGKYLRAPIPLPRNRLAGKVTIGATFTFASETDPEDPGNYSRAGLHITFRPDDEVFAKDDAVDPKSESFFTRSAFDSEATLRLDAQKWETTLNRSKTKLGSKLHNPVFDIHYNARENGGETRTARAIPYALVVTVKSPRTPDLYDQVLRTYAGRLEALQPIIDLPIRV